MDIVNVHEDKIKREKLNENQNILASAYLFLKRFRFTHSLTLDTILL